MILIVFFRVLLSVSANAVQKRLLLDGAGVNQTWILTYSIMLGPAAVVAACTWRGVDAWFWRDILLGGGLDAIGNLAMVAALRGTDLSIFGPLNALRPILALAGGWLFLGESPSSAGLTGIGITFLGALVLLVEPGKRTLPANRREVWKMLLLRISGLSLGTLGAVFLKRAALRSTAEATVAAWIFFGLVVLLLAAMFQQRGRLPKLITPLGTHKKWLALHAAIFLTMQWLTIVIFQRTLLAYSFVFFQLGMVLQVVVGRVFFREPAFARRMLGAVIMSAGSALILLRG